VGRTARAGARGTASTFSTRTERSEIARIEKVIGRKMERRAVPGLAEIVEIKPAAPKYLFKSRMPRRRRAM
jgi:superfamily II DNA/RNA helicase